MRGGKDFYRFASTPAPNQITAGVGFDGDTFSVFCFVVLGARWGRSLSLRVPEKKGLDRQTDGQQGDPVKVPFFLSSTTKNGEEVNFRIQNLTLDRLEEVVDTMLNKNLNEELFVKAAGISKSIEAITEMQKLYYSLLNDSQNAALVCCVDDERAEIAGFNMLYRGTNKDNMIEEMAKEVTHGFCDPFDKLNIEVYLGGAGLYVNEDYRGCGVATQLLKARKPLCEELSIPLTGAWFTGLGSQKAAEKAGYEVLGEMSYEELAEKTDLTFENAPESCKFMVLKIDSSQ
ncbi:hypothetical protein EVAR_28031_1 [Eumeta japonica]|uniref:N-acetyltransferase domain-containing protein n=1 Tax=Eumeta variegata TaxID=151549 RepID=A0A4C1W8G4_EUMVA|nr:hypothetical protein EVAR_28031_1 [Eumeta japonica]